MTELPDLPDPTRRRAKLTRVEQLLLLGGVFALSLLSFVTYSIGSLVSDREERSVQLQEVLDETAEEILIEVSNPSGSRAEALERLVEIERAVLEVEASVRSLEAALNE